MAATDKPFHNQRTLDIVFGVSNILMLLSVVWMMYQDYAREYKTEQRIFRNVEVAVAQRLALQSIPSDEEFSQAEAKVKAETEKRETRKDDLAKARATFAGLKPAKETAEAAFQSVKADVESITSFRSIALEHGDAEAAGRYDRQLETLNTQLAAAQARRDDILAKMKAEQAKIDEIDGPYTKAAAAFKKVSDKLDAQVKLALTKRWGFGDWLRTQPVIDGFASPIKIHQFTINDIPIDYNFKQVTRFDRCMSCHLGIDRPAYSRANLLELTQEAKHKDKLDVANSLYDRRVKVVDPKDAATIPNPHGISLVTLSKDMLTPARITEFAAHPRLDLFVGANSKHPAEKFGCTSCHYGQGSGTSFGDASHSPNTSLTLAAWSKERHWEQNHMWDFPMRPSRFIESSCLKCHHEVTDLISTDNRVEAPKLLRGFNLIKENGCFGCHEISGWKGADRVGPDLRLEPSPPLEDLDPIERERAQNDTDNRPGSMRKVGPSLARVSEKVSVQWMERWIKSPSSFRPDTKMPHYYGLSNNDEAVLKKSAPEQATFPNTEIASIAFFLKKTSDDFLSKAAQVRAEDAAQPEVALKDKRDLVDLLNRGRLDAKDQATLKAIKERMKFRTVEKLNDLAPKHKGLPERGRVLFTEKGCLSCHTHDGTHVAQNSAKPELNSPAVHSDALFGPNLTKIAEKVGRTATARNWLIQWVMNPQFHSPRSRMPVTHLRPEDAADIAAWLLRDDKKVDDKFSARWDTTKLETPTKDDLKKLARVYLVRLLSQSDMDKFLAGTLTKEEKALINSDLGADEQVLVEQVHDDDAFKYYLGKKAVSRLGCYACHDIPGFENAKSIGVGLNDWGKKPADRLAFEDIKNFYKKHYFSVDSLVDSTTNKPHASKIEDGVEKEPYEKFFTEQLTGHLPSREGYLNQKIRDPRSYDFNRIRSWDDRSRMPRFTLARPRPHSGEKADDFKARMFKDEAEAREAVATFVLGLVAESVPSKSINQPKGDRLAEVKGRQILDKYNCGGCHLIRPGVYDFAPGDESLQRLGTIQAREWKEILEKGEIVHGNHISWVGRNPLPADKLTAFGSLPVLDPEGGKVQIVFSEAMRFQNADRKIVNMPAGVRFSIPLAELGIDPATIKTQEDFDRRFNPVAAYGGGFADLLAPYLFKKDKLRYPQGAGDYPDSRSALPPPLIGQGERTQSDWLYKFLLDPTQVRRMSILRMPKFNMSPEEAKGLVHYFAAVTRQTNPGIGLSFPYDNIAGRQEFSGDYWKKKTGDYIALLKATKEKDQAGKGMATSLYDARLKSYKSVWDQIRKDREPVLMATIKEIDDRITTNTQTLKTREAALEKEQDASKKEALTKEIDALKTTLSAAADEKVQTQTALKRLDVAVQQKLWETEEAYAGDAYRLLTSRELCTKCHQVGNLSAGEQVKQGPPLALAHERLRPEWIERWVDKPQRFVPYSAMMPPYFDKNELRYQSTYAGRADLQIRALRDALMNYPRMVDLPINRAYNPDRK